MKCMLTDDDCRNKNLWVLHTSFDCVKVDSVHTNVVVTLHPRCNRIVVEP